MAYKDEILALRDVSFNSIRNIAKNYIMSLPDKEKDEFIIRNRHFFEVQPFYYFDKTNEEEEKKELQGKRDE